METHEGVSTVIPPSHSRLIQLIYDRYAATGKWPKSRALQIDFIPEDFWAIVNEVDYHLIRNRGEISEPDSLTYLSLEGIAACVGSERHTSLFVRVLQICIGIYKNKPEDPTVTSLDLQEVLSLPESESDCAMGLLFVGDRIWSSASGSLNEKITELRLYPDILKYSAVADVKDYLEIVRKSRPKRMETEFYQLRSMEVKDKLSKTFSTLHPRIIERCEDLFLDEHYSESVEAGFKVVRDRLRKITGYERGQDAFGKANLRVPGAAAPNVDDDFNDAVKFLLMAIDRFRNEKSHTAEGRIDDPGHAYEYLSMSSLAMRFLERCESQR